MKILRRSHNVTIAQPTRTGFWLDNTTCVEGAGEVIYPHVIMSPFKTRHNWALVGSW